MDTKTRELAFALSNGFCRCSPNCLKQATDIHHMMPNTKYNRRSFPLFIDSIFNCCPANNGCHLNKNMPKITRHEAAIYEEWLKEFKTS